MPVFHIRVALLITWLAAALSSMAVDADEPSPAGRKHTVNRLAKESSPYLLQHAHNPVDWFPWGPEAFAKAKTERKLVFLSIGYSSCHWCHVMERESFENLEVAKLLNDWFVCIKVDREERPDIDAIYMASLNRLGNRGGWPMSLFLTHEGKPIIGGTYWPPDDRLIDNEKVRGFKTILRVMHEWYTTKPEKVADQASRLASATKAMLQDSAGSKAVMELDRSLVEAAVDGVRQEFDSEYGGFGSKERGFQGTKFPVPSYLKLLLHEFERTRANDLAAIIKLTLDRMAHGGIYDQIGGGFHRYSTERTWTIPHFEKMLYDNAQLVEVYALAYRLTQEPEYRRIAEEVLAFVGREMTSPDGVFYSALDADSSGGEGTFYVWTAPQIDQALAESADAALIKAIYGFDGRPNFEGRSYIPVLSKPAKTAKELRLSEGQLRNRLAHLRQKLLDVRCRRPRLFRDTKVLTGWNGQMIAAYAMAGQILEQPEYIQIASRAADFILHNLRTGEGRLLHSYAAVPGREPEARLDGYLDDYAYVIHGLLSLHDATGQAKWLEEAKSLTDTMDQLFNDKASGGFYYTSTGHEQLFARCKDQYDSAEPSGNSVTSRNLVRLWSKTGDARFKEQAVRNMKAFAGVLKSNPTNLTAMAEAIALYVDGNPLPSEPHVALKPVSQDGARKSDAVVKTTAQATPADAEGKQTITVTMTIDPTWHIYANPVGAEDLESMQTNVMVEAKAKLEEMKVQYPPGKLIDDKVIGKYKVYEDKVDIKAIVKRKAGDRSPLEVTAKFQACTDKQCLLPATVKITVPE